MATLLFPDTAGRAQPPLPPPTPQESNCSTSRTRNSTCEICIEPMSFSEKKFTPCDHPFCSDCMIKYIDAKLEDNISEIPCPALGCKQLLDPLTCQNLIAPHLFLRWCDVLCESAVMSLERSYCPNRNCSALVVNECRRGKAVKKTTCPNCKRIFCFQCMLPWHAGLRCEESRELSGEDADFVFGVLAKRRKWKRCPRCRHFVERVNGCVIIKCRCHAQFCYNCGAEVDQHWCKCQRVRRVFLWMALVTVFLMISYAIIMFPWRPN